ncbi:MAG: MAPEG family protein [Myxococcota bacterium]
MTAELRWLLWTALLSGSLWIPYIVGINVTDYPGKAGQFSRPPDPATMEPWVHRAWRAHLNSLEQLLPFAVVVLVGRLADVSTPATRFCAGLYFALRLVHAIGMISGLARLPVRPALYFTGWVAMLVFAWQILTHS